VQRAPLMYAAADDAQIRRHVNDVR